MNHPARQKRETEALPLGIVLAVRDAQRTLLARALHGIVRVEFCTVPDEAERLVLERNAAALFLPLRDESLFNIEEFISRLRSKSPHLGVGVVDWLNSTDDGARALDRSRPFEIVRPTDRDFRERARNVVTQARHNERQAEMADRLALGFSGQVKEAVRKAIAEGARPRSVRDLAAAVGMRRKTLDRRLSRSAPLTARQFIAWGRLIAAAMWLEQGDVLVPAIAEQLRFASPSALRNLLQRYVRTTPTQVRMSGGAAFVFARVLELVEKRRHAS